MPGRDEAEAEGRRVTPESPGETKTDPDAAGQSTDAEALAAEAGERYLLGEEVGRGGLGRVVRARDRRLERTVAVKQLLHDSPDLAARFRREAMLAARLEHPGIVAVHDVGTSEDGAPYYAMKLVAGRTLRELIDGTGSYRERVALLPHAIAVADAIAYAHDQGVIHRDLKPSNVIVGDFGETVVVDWGLAKELAQPDDPSAAAVVASSAEVTRAGAVLGTPSYMPPEQARGEAVDARADVYALGALLYHVLTGALPYEGSDSREVLANVLEGPPRPVSAVESRVSPELAAIVGKAMARQPGERYANAAGLVEDLRRFETGRLVQAHAYSARERVVRWLRQRRRALGYAAVVALAGVSVYGVARSPTPAPSCDVPANALAGAWDDEQKAAVRAAVLATGKPAARATADRVTEILDDYAGDWRAMRQAACEATHVHGVQSADALDLGMQCLDKRRAALDALVDALASIGADGDLNAVVPAAAKLPSIAACADTEALKLAVPLPDDPRQRDRIQALGRDIEAARSARSLGRYAEGLTQITEVVARSRELAYAPLLADALYERAMGLEANGKYEDARAAYLHAALAAAQAAHDALVADAWFGVIRTLSDHLNDAKGAEALLPVAEAAAARVPDNAGVQGRYLEGRGLIAWAAGDYETALEYIKRAAEQFETLDNPLQLAVSHNDMGILLKKLDRYQEALAEYQRSLDLYDSILGPDHPNSVPVVHNLAILNDRLGNAEKALQLARRALKTKERTLGPEHPDTLNGIQLLGSTLTLRGRHADARDLYAKGLAIAERELPYGNNPRILLRFSLGYAHVKLGELALGNKLLEESLREAMETHHESDLLVIEMLTDAGGVIAEHGDLEVGLAWCKRALQLGIRELEPDHDELAAAEQCVGVAELARGRPLRAVPHLERALRVRLQKTGDAVRIAYSRASLAEALWDGNVDKKRALELAHAALAGFLEQTDEQSAEQAAAIEKWMEERGMSP